MAQRLRVLLALAFVLALLAVPAAGAAPGDRLVTLAADKAAYAAADPVVVHVILTNTTGRSLRVLRWFTPADGVEEALFAVQRDGAPVRYLGPVFKRPAPTAADFVVLAPGASASYDVDLSAAYDLSVTGTYTIVYDSGILKSDSLSVFIEGRASGPAPEVSIDAVAGSTSFNKCSSTQQTQLLTARTNASTISGDGLSYLNANKTGPRYTTWFGVYDGGRYSHVTTNFSAIKNAMDNAAVTFDCGCKKKYYAYVYPDRPYTIYLCSVYWSAPAMGTDSQAGTLVHEMSHFYVVASTDDYVYGQTNAKNLAISNPNNAVDNADNHEYFAENTPPLN